ncbi:MAG: hypothetical protein OXC67_00765 [Flavobacteriaceae bacterium]|nr:hypothetical protein [Flavobacteriaceae bacterium]MCY4298183.1 hypothetical protein [Flavobacteriaceae bacterium]
MDRYIQMKNVQISQLSYHPTKKGIRKMSFEISGLTKKNSKPKKMMNEVSSGIRINSIIKQSGFQMEELNRRKINQA